MSSDFLLFQELCQLFYDKLFTFSDFKELSIKRIMFCNRIDYWRILYQIFAGGKAFQCRNPASEAGGVCPFNLGFCYQITFDAQFLPGRRYL